MSQSVAKWVSSSCANLQKNLDVIFLLIVFLSTDPEMFQHFPGEILLWIVAFRYIVDWRAWTRAISCARWPILKKIYKNFYLGPLKSLIVGSFWFHYFSPPFKWCAGFLRPITRYKRRCVGGSIFKKFFVSAFIPFY